MPLNIQSSQQEKIRLRFKGAQIRYRLKHGDRLRATARALYRQKREEAKTDPEKMRLLQIELEKDRALDRKRHPIYYKKNKNRIAEKSRKRYLVLREDPILWRMRLDRQRDRVKKWRKENPEKLRNSVRAWHNTERGRLLTNAAKIRRKKKQPEFHMKLKLRSRMKNALLLQGVSGKCDKTVALLGCDPIQFRKHLESLFHSGMSWDNREKWEIDHIRPCSSFNLLDPEQQRCCFHYTNLQPLWREDNRKKANKWLG